MTYGNKVTIDFGKIIKVILRILFLGIFFSHDGWEIFTAESDPEYHGNRVTIFSEENFLSGWDSGPHGNRVTNEGSNKVSIDWNRKFLEETQRLSERFGKVGDGNRVTIDGFDEKFKMAIEE